MTRQELCATAHPVAGWYVYVYGFIQYSGEAGERGWFKLYPDGAMLSCRTGKRYNYRSFTWCHCTGNRRAVRAHV